MHINFILIPIIIILGLILGTKDTRQSRLIYIAICCVIFLFVGAMRSPEWFTYTYGIDTLNYKHMFESSFDMSWQEFWALAYARYFGNEGEGDIGFMALNKAISYFTTDFHKFSLIADLIFFIPFGIILYRHTSRTRQLIFAFVFYIAMIQIFLLAGARQIFALGFDMMALISIIGKKRLLTAVFVIMAMSIHLSSLLFVIPLLMIWYEAKPKVLKLTHLLCFVLFPLVLIFPNEIIRYMGNFIGMEKYARYGMNEIQGGASTFIFLIETISLFCLIAIREKDFLLNKSIHIFYVMLPLLTFFAPLIRSNGSMIRISLYYHIFIVLLVPFAIDCFFTKRKQGFAYLIAIGALALLNLSNGGPEYYFYWEK